MNGLYDMMYVIGKGRFVKLIALILFNAAIIYGVIYYLEPEAVAAEARVVEVSQDNTRLRSEIDGMPALLEQYKNNEKEYEKLLASGFIGAQDRIAARKLIDYFREQNNVSGIEYEFSPLKRFENDYRTVSLPDEPVQTDMTLNISAMLDLEMFAFIQYFEETLPGMLVLRKMTVSRNDDALNQAALESISKGEKVNLVTAELNYEWLSLSPRIVQTQPVQ